MSNNIIPFQDMTQMASAIAKSNLFGMKDVNEVLALMLVAQAEGLHPATAARDYHIIQGRPALKADAMLARFQQAGGKVEWTDYTDQKVTGIFSHPNGGTLEVSWSIDQANRAGLNKPNSGWAKYPRAMLRARVVSEGIRSVYPGCVIGTYTPEEVEDFEPRPVKMKDITPEPEVMPHHVIVEAREGDLSDIGQGQYLLLLPDESVYSSHHTTEDWIEAYNEMIMRIGRSEKLDETMKAEKIKALKEANRGVLGRLKPTDRVLIAQATQEARGGPETAPKPLGPIMTAEEFLD